jgi:Protein of unknown function (DUF3999)
LISAIVLAAVVTRTVTPAYPGANRLDPDIAILSGTSAPLRYTIRTERGERRFVFQGGLDDLRLHDQNGAEVQYLIVPPPSHVPIWRTARSILTIPSTKTSSGIEGDFGGPISIDRVAISGIPAPFLKRVRVEASGDRVHWTLLAAETTLFDLPDQQLHNLEVAFAPGNYRYVRLVWDDRSSARVHIVSELKARLSEPGAQWQTLTVPLTFRKVASEAYKSRYRVSLPGPHLPVAAIELRVTNANVFRDASVSESRFDGSTLVPEVLGSAKLRRAERDGAVAAQMAVPISGPVGADLEIAIEDGNSGPLSIDSIVAQFAPLPWIYFETTSIAPITASYGDLSLHAPRYDVEASRKSVESARPPLAAWSGVAANVRPEPGTAGLPIAGAAIDRRPFRRIRSVEPIPRGLTTLVLDADVLAHSVELNDVRLINPSGKQVPYLLEKRDAPLLIALRIPPRSVSGTSSLYRFELPYDRFPAGTRLMFTTTARVFDRDVQLQRPADQSHGRDAEVLEQTTWRSADPESNPPPLTFTAPLAGTAVELRVDERDNAPLPITSAQLLLPSYALRFFSSGTPLTLLYDAPSASAPRYDLALLAPRLMSESSREVVLPPVRGSTKASARTERAIFWSVIATATVILLATLGGLLKSEVKT